MKNLFSVFMLILTPFLILGQQVDVIGELSADSIDVKSGIIKNLSDPINTQDAATKAYVDALQAQILALNNILLDAGYNGIISDIEGNLYKTINIDDQIWMADNLRVSKYNDGTPIPLVTGGTAWSNLNSPGYCFYDTIGTNYLTYSQDTFGALYNYYVVADTNSLNVCPTGWHIPSNVELSTLVGFLGGNPVAGGKMKETGTIHWDSPNTDATNEGGFSGLPGGFRSWSSGGYANLGASGQWWSSTEFNSSNVYNRQLNFSNGAAGLSLSQKGNGYSVRCLRD